MTNVVGVIRAAKLAAFLALALVAAGCANKPNDPGMAGAGHASPGSPQDFVVNVGDRVFFESDSQNSRRNRSRRWRSKRSGSRPMLNTLSSSRATPMSAARVSTTSRLAPGAHRPSATTSSRVAFKCSACVRFPTVRSVRSRSVTIFHAGRRTVGL